MYLTLKGPGGRADSPSTFRAIISQKFFSAPQAFMTYFFEVLRNFWAQFSEKSGVRFLKLRNIM